MPGHFASHLVCGVRPRKMVCRGREREREPTLVISLAHRVDAWPPAFREVVISLSSGTESVLSLPGGGGIRKIYETKKRSGKNQLCWLNIWKYTKGWKNNTTNKAQTNRFCSSASHHSSGGGGGGGGGGNFDEGGGGWRGGTKKEILLRNMGRIWMGVLW